ncbi:bacillithiol biosynthesis cysteine-adding enzyme BshC [Lacinutrix sp. MedPE-SW]|uniref:bacillithiol biosynthesis cysteine-adding enzyme BshC n=1 Tax=Lacinutrix sp. MedPE-SW TaxID=1860087 RepID=UPI00091010CC|nr:bacillithiol biosynthesis cysteine-adding enzyme BshC [Lacinutrix sp. MedPE-SW]OIQ22762.1 MAG: bacillithiol biosynthesis cysteine-adding enzyme BshC [Lacinutrix sp. MedPE-SW]
MPSYNLSYKSTGYFSQLICNYLAEAEALRPFYNRFPNLENFQEQIKEKASAFSQETRTVLTSVLSENYKMVEASQATIDNIESLRQSNTFTVTTGHQLNLFTGPLYFLHKIVSTINLAKTLKAKFPENNFVPVYWMATEDHDFDEINYFNFKGKKIQWNREASGAVGELDTNGLDAVLEIFSQELGIGKNADRLKTLFKSAYLEHETLAQATFYLANELFKDYGLVVVEANNRALKNLFIPYAEKELTQQISYQNVSKVNKQIEALSQDYKIQVNPREINLFYITKNIRERIVFNNNSFKVLNTNITWSKSEIIQHLNEAPECFSPNVILRPLYQEIILPNLCYIGGGGELAYWFQLKSNFKANGVVFPMLLLRNSVLIQTQQQANKLKRLDISNEDIFLKRESFINKKVREISNIDIDFSTQVNHLKTQFETLYELAKKTDKSFLGAVAAQEKKQINGLENLEKRLLTAQKRKLKDQIERITDLQNQLFPNKSLQERNTNFSELYLEFGENLIPNLIKHLEPLQGEFTVLTF